MVTLVICHAAMTGWVTKIVDGELQKTSKIGLRNAITIQKALKAVPRKLQVAEWPRNAKPKGLYSFWGKILLDEIIRRFKPHVDEIRFVAGYKLRLIQRYNRYKRLGMKVMYNPEWGEYHRSELSMRVGLKDLDDDVVITLGDVILTDTVIEELFASKNPLVMSSGHIYKVRRDHLRLLDDLPKQAGGFQEIEVPLAILFRANNAEEVSAVSDLDYYSLTDEYKLKVLYHLLMAGWTWDEIKNLQLSITLDWLRQVAGERAVKRKPSVNLKKKP